MRLRTAMLFVNDFPRMREFYRAMLGVEPAGNGSWAVFDLGASEFALHSIPRAAGRGIEIASPPMAREDTPLKLVFAVADVGAERARLESLGAVMVERPWQEDGESCDGMDPEGNVFQIASADSGPF